MENLVVTDERTLACIGLNGFERARLRLLLAEAGERVQARWRMGQPEQADLLILAPGSLEAEAAALRARGRGVRCVHLGAPGDVGDEFLPAGFGVDDVVRVLKSVRAAQAPVQRVDARSPEFFQTETGGTLADDHAIPEAVDLERFLRRDSGEHTLEKIVPYQLEDTTSIEPVERAAPSSRAQARSSERDPFARSASSSSAASSSLSGVQADYGTGLNMKDEHDASGHPLSFYLTGQALMAPSQIVLEGTEPLILDPKNGVYMIVGDLASARPYATAHWRSADFERLTTRELERWRALCEPQPYLRLRWLIALCNGDGWLPRHLDPGGSYRVREMLHPGPHFEAQVRIGQVLRDWLRLHEVAAQAGVDMQSVFDTVAAYDAIGWLEWRPRERFR
ncbi:hypothetical protein [Oleiagrimonas sp. MCCC 1A03011]|uniref:hypothetical protein n=1 Tax=Oleiagrimonas sp. MCCC 1A03011 TaxID=1926883 RepID=UPI000DC30B1A|nr:hypothetical protein [Oleiagrimonas sp. MCCC 1A03011]RAP59125.1 hypothetical protein BTJ49_00040 [Oleiagrimonas sp. MCCC 1A03011]